MNQPRPKGTRYLNGQKFFYRPKDREIRYPSGIKRQTIEDYCARQARSKAAFSQWLEAIKYADWNDPPDIKSTYNSVDFLGDGSNRVIFNIGGNHYRMICKYAFGKRTVHLFVCWIGTHAEYDKLCDKGLQYVINKY